MPHSLRLPLLDPILDALSQAKKIVVLTGAGASAPSGIPTFRDSLDGYWSKFKPEELATQEAFLRNPELVTRWYDQRRIAILNAKPNLVHFAISDLQAIFPNLVVITQNVDGLHTRAGSRNVLEIHGSITRWCCRQTGEKFNNLPVPLPSYPCRVRQISQQYQQDGNGFIQADVVLFGDPLPSDTFDAAVHACQTCDLFLSIGTSGIVYPAAGFAVKARYCGATTFEFNLGLTELSPAFDYSLFGDASVILPEIVEKFSRMIEKNDQ